MACFADCYGGLNSGPAGGDNKAYQTTLLNKFGVWPGLH